MKKLPLGSGWLVGLCLGLTWFAAGLCAEEQPFRPQGGTFAPLEKAKSYRGELVFVDHVNRRGSLRVLGGGEVFFQHVPQPFAMLPYGVVRYQGAPADLRHIPMGTLLHVSAFLPPDPHRSPVPVVQNPAVERPAENHVLLLEDEPSHCLREGKVWRLKEIELQQPLPILTTALSGLLLASLTRPESLPGQDTPDRLIRNTEPHSPEAQSPGRTRCERGT
jgi:hypothetical protein